MCVCECVCVRLCTCVCMCVCVPIRAERCISESVSKVRILVWAWQVCMECQSMYGVLKCVWSAKVCMECQSMYGVPKYVWNVKVVCQSSMHTYALLIIVYNHAALYCPLYSCHSTLLTSAWSDTTALIPGVNQNRMYDIRWWTFSIFCSVFSRNTPRTIRYTVLAKLIHTPHSSGQP